MPSGISPRIICSLSFSATAEVSDCRGIARLLVGSGAIISALAHSHSSKADYTTIRIYCIRRNGRVLGNLLESLLGADPQTEGIAFVQHQVGLRVHESRSFDAGINLSVDDLNRSLEDAAHDAFLPPDFAFSQLPVGKKARHFGARSRPARGAVICFARAEHKILAVHARQALRTVQFHVVDFRPGFPGNPGSGQRLADGPGKVGEG